MNFVEICDVCDCTATPAISITVQRRQPFGLRYLTVCEACAEDYDSHRPVECANCDMIVPRHTEWSHYDNESGEYFCFLCAGIKGYYEAYPTLRPSKDRRRTNGE
jgi:formate dehydrogenase maturation protein FdhE